MTAKHFKIAPLSPLYKFSPPSLLKSLQGGAIRIPLGNPDLNYCIKETSNKKIIYCTVLKSRRLFVIMVYDSIIKCFFFHRPLNQIF